MKFSDLIGLKFFNEYITITQYTNSDKERKMLLDIFDPNIFRYYSKPYNSCNEFIIEKMDKLKSCEQVPFLIYDNKINQVVGTFSLKNIDLKNKVIEIGSGWMGIDFFHKYYITVTNLLLLNYLFEVLGFSRVQWKTDVTNIISQKAAIAIGYKREGVLRSYILRDDGECRDVMMFSMIKSEWEEAKIRLKKRVASKLKISEKNLV